MAGLTLTRVDFVFNTRGLGPIASCPDNGWILSLEHEARFFRLELLDRKLIWNSLFESFEFSWKNES